MRQLFLSVFGAGYLPYAPGTWGSIAGFAVGVLLSKTILFYLMCIVFVLALFAMRKIQGDPSWIVIDEVIGIWFAMLLVDQQYWILSFILFRIFDIFKPWPVSYFENIKPPALAIMADDLCAGLISAFMILCFL